MKLYRVLLGVADEAVVTLKAVQSTQGAAYRAWEAQREKARAQAMDPEADWKGLAESLHRALDVAIRDADAEGKRALELESQLVRFLKAETTDRATDYDLGRIAHAVDQPDSYKDRWELGGEGLHRRYVAMATAVAARVRKEPGLVDRLVAAKCDFDVRCLSGGWDISARVPGGQWAHTDHADCASSDVPTTLARLAGLDGAT